MQVSASLIAAQQAAREAQAQFQARVQTTQVAPKQSAGDSFAAALGDFSQKPKPAAAALAAPTGQNTPVARVGSLLDIKV
jgi:hypothetical protein